MIHTCSRGDADFFSLFPIPESHWQQYGRNPWDKRIIRSKIRPSPLNPTHWIHHFRNKLSETLELLFLVKVTFWYLAIAFFKFKKIADFCVTISRISNINILKHFTYFLMKDYNFTIFRLKTVFCELWLSVECEFDSILGMSRSVIWCLNSLLPFPPFTFSPPTVHPLPPSHGHTTDFWFEKRSILVWVWWEL